MVDDKQLIYECIKFIIEHQFGALNSEELAIRNILLNELNKKIYD